MDWQGELEQYLYANTVPPPGGDYMCLFQTHLRWVGAIWERVGYLI